MIRVDLVDPPAYSRPYDHALAAALARLGGSVRLVTSSFAYGEAPDPDGYTREEFFYRHAFGPAGSRVRALSKRAEHPLDMLRYRRTAAEVVHFEWLTVPRLDLRLLPQRPTVLTIHDPLERGRDPMPASAFASVDAIVVHSEYAKQSVVEQHGLSPDRVHVIHHGVLGDFRPPTGQNSSSIPSELRDTGEPVVLSYGLIRPYKGIGTLLEAWRGIEDAQLWIVGRPMMDVSGLLAAAPAGARLVPRFVTPAEEHALFERADLVVLPYEHSERFGFSGVLATALGHGKAIVLSDIGGFSEVAALGAVRLVAAWGPAGAARHTRVADRRRGSARPPRRSGGGGGSRGVLVGRGSQGHARAVRDNRGPMTVVLIAFWVAAALLVYTQVGYALVLALLARLRRPRPVATWEGELPTISAIVAAYNEQEVIAQRIANLRSLDYPPQRLQVIVASDGSSDRTAARAHAAGADLVLELPRGGKIRAQDAAVAEATGELLVFSDANASWQREALKRLVGAFADPKVGYVCGDVMFTDDGGTNQEGLYWRYEMWLRRMESGLSSVTSGNGAIYATRRESYLKVDPLAGHDLSFPFNMVKRGWRAVYVTDARATEKMAPSIEGEFTRKRRMARRTWPTVFASGLMSPRGYSPLYALMIFSHRVLRYLVPFLHVLVLAANIALIGQGWVYLVTLALQLALYLGAALAPLAPARPLLVARYYVVTNWALAAGVWDFLRGERSPVWETVEGTR